MKSIKYIMPDSTSLMLINLGMGIHFAICKLSGKKPVKKPFHAVLTL